jgi:hypothetical protein
LAGYVEEPPLDFGVKDIPKSTAWNLKSRLAEIGKIERDQAKERQFFAGIASVRTGFRPHPDPKIDTALNRIWQSGPNGRALYVKIAKGVTLLTANDVLALGECLPETCEHQAGEILVNEIDRNREKDPTSGDGS